MTRGKIYRLAPPRAARIVGAMNGREERGPKRDE